MYAHIHTYIHTYTHRHADNLVHTNDQIVSQLQAASIHASGANIYASGDASRRSWPERDSDISNRSEGSPDKGPHRDDSDSDTNTPAKRRSSYRSEGSPHRELLGDRNTNHNVGTGELALVKYEGGADDLSDNEKLGRRLAEV